MDDRRPDTSSAAVRPVHARSSTAVAVVGTAVLVAVLASPIPTHTRAADAVTAAVGLVAVGLAVWSRPSRAAATARVTRRSAAPWVVLAVVVLVLEVGALLHGDRPEFPTLSYLLGPEFVDATVRFVGYVAWICGGFWLVRR